MASRAANTKLIKKSIIEENRSKLLNAPVKEREAFSTSEAIQQMSDEISKVLNRGYSYDEVASMLSTGGIDIKGTTLRQYMTAVKRGNSKNKPRKKKIDSKKVVSDTNNDESENKGKENNDIMSKSSKPLAKNKIAPVNKSDNFVDMPNEL